MTDVNEFEPTKVISLKTQLHAVNACVKRSSQRSLTDGLINDVMIESLLAQQSNDI